MPGPISWAARRPTADGRPRLPPAVARDVRPRAGAGAHAVGLRLPLDGHALGLQPARRRAACSARTASRRTRSSCSSRSCSTRAPRCPTSRSGTRTSWAGGRSTPTRSRPRCRRSACRPTCCRSGTRWRVMAALKLFVAAFGAFLLARAFGMRFAGRAAVRARVRLQPLVGHLGVVDDDERLGPAALAVPARRSSACAGPGRCRSPGWRPSRASSSSAATRRRASR